MLKEITSIVLSSFLILSLSIGVFGLSAQVFLHRQTYDDIMEQQVYSLLADKGFDVTPLKPQIANLTEEALAYVRGDTDSLHLVVDVRPALEQQLKDVPDCDLNSGIVDVCVPPGMDRTAFMETFFDNVQTKYDLSTMVDLSVLDKARQGVEIFYKVIFACFILSGILILLLLFLRKRKALGIIDMDLFLVAISMYAASYYLKHNLAGITSDWTYQAIATNLLFTMLGTMEYYALFIIILGIALLVLSIILSFVIRPRKKKKKSKR